MPRLRVDFPRLRWPRATLIAYTVSLTAHAAVLGGAFYSYHQPPQLLPSRPLEVTFSASEIRANATPNSARPIAPRRAAPAPAEPARRALLADDTSAAHVAPTPTPTPPVDAADNAVTDARYDVAAFHNPKPPYPLSMRRRGIEGTVIVAATVRADGSCGDVRLKQSSGHAPLDTAALDTVRQWRFLSARRGGTPVEATIEVPIVFRLAATFRQ